MMRLIAYIVVGLLAYGAFLVATFPATQAVALLQQQLPQVRAAGVTGTAWSGEAAVLQVAGHNLERVDWRIKPWSVLLGELEIELALDDPDLNGHVTLGLKPDGAVHLSDVDLRLAAAEFSRLFNVPAGLGGQFELQLQSAALRGRNIQSAEGLLRWRRAAVTAPVVQPLGEFVAQLTTTEGGIQAQVKDEGGPLQLDGTALLTPAGAYNFNGAVAVRDPQQQMLVQGVRALGRAGADGRVALRYAGSL